jgi:hypothetical protein
VANANRSSARPAFYSIERSTRDLHMGNVGSEKGLKTSNCGFGCSGLFPVSEGHKLIQNFLQSLEPPFRNLKVFVVQLNSDKVPLISSAMIERAELVASTSTFA